MSSDGSTAERVTYSGEGLPELREEIAQLMQEVTALERASYQTGVGPEERQRTYRRMLDVEARLERLIDQLRELNRQIALIESWKRR